MDNELARYALEDVEAAIERLQRRAAKTAPMAADERREGAICSACSQEADDDCLPRKRIGDAQRQGASHRRPNTRALERRHHRRCHPPDAVAGRQLSSSRDKEGHSSGLGEGPSFRHGFGR